MNFFRWLGSVGVQTLAWAVYCVVVLVILVSFLLITWLDQLRSIVHERLHKSQNQPKR